MNKAIIITIFVFQVILLPFALPMITLEWLKKRIHTERGTHSDTIKNWFDC